MERYKKELLRLDQNYISDFFDPNFLANQPIGHGMRMRVYPLRRTVILGEVQGAKYNVNKLSVELPPDFSVEEWVAKVPRSERIIPYTLLYPHSTPRAKLKIMGIGGEYFPSFILPTVMVIRQGKFCIFQRRLEDFDDIDPQNIQGIPLQIEELKAGLQRLRGIGMCADLGLSDCLKTALGFKDARARMTNLVIEHHRDQNFVWIPDVSLMQIGKVPSEYQDLFQIRRRIFGKAGYWLTQALLTHYFGINLR